MLCFVGHGAFGIMTKQAWLPYFAVAGIGPERAYALMPIIGAVDITMGLLVLVWPAPIIALWMIAWAVWTALLRPLAGEPVWETLERAGNYGVPAALLFLMSFDRSLRGFFRPAGIRPLTPDTLRLTRRILIATVALLLAGHGALGVMQKPGLTSLYAAAVPPEVATQLTPAVGWLEIALAAGVIFFQAPAFLLGVALWKLLTETLFVAAGAPVWEVIERGGSYAAPIALAMVMLLYRREYPSATATDVS